MKRFHTIEKITDDGTIRILFKRGNKIIAFAENKFRTWLYWFGKPSKRPSVCYWKTTYEDVEKDIFGEVNKEV